MKRSAAVATLAVVCMLSCVLLIMGLHVYLTAPLQGVVDTVADVTDGSPSQSLSRLGLQGVALPVSRVQFSTAMTAGALDKPYEEPYIMPGLTAVTTGGFAATASSSAPGYYPWQAFDQGPACWVPEAKYDVGTGVYGGTTTTTITDASSTITLARGEFLQLVLPSPFMLVEYTLSVLGTWAPDSWTLVGSNDGTKWKCLDVQDNYAFPNEGGPSRVFAITQYLGSFSQFRVVIRQLAPQGPPAQQNVFIQEVSLGGLKDDFPD